jgi:transposase
LLEGMLTMPRPYPAEFRSRAVALVRAGKPVTTTAAELGISQSCMHNWIRQDQVNWGELPGVATSESVELRRARKRIRQLELEVEILTKASQFLTEDKSHPKGFT